MNQRMCFRVSVDLSYYFSDERARCFVLVPGGGGGGARRVSWLARRLQRLFGSRLAGCALLARGHLLPPDEPLRLLRPGDELRVLPAPWSCTDLNCQEITNADILLAPSNHQSEGPYLAEEAIVTNDKAEENIGLGEMKQRALAMLASMQPCTAAAAEPPAPAPRRRRRVRRRPQRDAAGLDVPAVATALGVDEEPTCATTLHAHDVEPASVARNADLCRAAPRRICALVGS